MSRKLVEFDLELVPQLTPTVIGLDLSPAKCGFVDLDGETVKEAAQIKAPKGISGERRAIWWRDMLVSRCSDSDLVVIEDFAFAQPNRAHEVGGVAYIVRIALAEEGCRVLKVPVGTNKKFATGVGNANKHQMILAAYKRWNFETKFDDVADALSLAKCGVAYLDPRSKRDQAVCDKVVLLQLGNE